MKRAVPDDGKAEVDPVTSAKLASPARLVSSPRGEQLKLRDQPKIAEQLASAQDIELDEQSDDDDDDKKSSAAIKVVEPFLAEIPAPDTNEVVEPKFVGSQPITSLCVIYPNLLEEPPLGYKQIHLPNAREGGHHVKASFVSFCSLQDLGAPVMEISLIFPEKKEVLPEGWQIVKLSTNGQNADVNVANLQHRPHLLTAYLCYRPNLAYVLRRFRTAASGPAELHTAQCLALLVAALYCQDAKLVTTTLDSVQMMDFSSLSRSLLSQFVDSLCQLMHLYLGNQMFVVILKMLSVMTGIFNKFWRKLSVSTCLSLMETCLLCRNADDAADARSSSMIRALFGSGAETIKDCRCTVNDFNILEDEKVNQTHTRIEDGSASQILCFSCRDFARHTQSSDREIANAILTGIVQRIALNKRLEHLFNRLSLDRPRIDHRADSLKIIHEVFNQCVDFRDRATLDALNIQPCTLDEPCLECAVAQRVCAFIHVTAQIASEPGPSVIDRRKSETIYRKEQALTLLRSLISGQGSLFRVNLGTGMILRRVVLPALLAACVTDHRPSFKIILQIIATLKDKFEGLLMIELGVIYDKLLLPIMTSQSLNSSVATKCDVLGLLWRVFDCPANMVSVYYNYDNHADKWPIFENVVEMLSDIVQARETGLVQQKITTAPIVAEKVGESGKVAEISHEQVHNLPAESEAENEDEFNQRQLSDQCVSLLAHIVQCMAERYQVPGVIPREPKRTIAGQMVNGGRRKLERTMSWAVRFDAQAKIETTFKLVQPLLKRKDLKKAVTFLRINGHCPSPQLLADWMFRNPDIDRSDLGDFLSRAELKQVLTKEEYKEMREAYVSKLTFSGLTLDQAMRVFLIEGGFMLPKESQQIDRLLETFGAVYSRANNGSLQPETVYCCTFALLLINTEATNPNVDSRTKHTFKMFCRDLRDMKVKPEEVSDDFARTMFDGILANPMSPDEIGTAPSKKVEEKKEEQPSPSVLANKHLRELTRVRKQCNEVIKNKSSVQKGKNTTKSSVIVCAMFKKSCLQAITALSSQLMDHTRDPVILNHCLDGLGYLAALASALGHDFATEFQAAMQPIAAFSYVEEHTRAGDFKAEHVLGYERRHAKEMWFRALEMLQRSKPEEACLEVLKQVAQIKARLRVYRAQSELMYLQEEMGNDIILVDTARTFVKRAHLDKLSDKKKREPRIVFLFNDIIVYGQPANFGRLTNLRVLNLSLCAIAEYESPEPGFIK